GPVDEGYRPRRLLPGAGPRPQHPERAHHPQRAVEPAAIGHGIEVGTDRQGGLRVAFQVGPGVAGFIDLEIESDLTEQLAEELSRPAPAIAPAEPLRAIVVA